MLEDARMTAVIPVHDLAKARTFWEKMIGLAPHVLKEAEGQVMYIHNNTALLVYQTDVSLDGTTRAVFVVDNVAREMAELKNHGVVFCDAGIPGWQTVDGMAEGTMGKGAWFKDLEDNLIALVELAG